MMEQAGISRGTAVSLLLGVLVYGPVINLFFAIGEEIGWRGFLYPALRQRMSTLPACLLVGAIWGLWHTPINLMGHNYGTSYPGFPWLGILGMCLLTTSAGTFLAWLSERSGSLWPAALAHGTINAAAQVASAVPGAEGQCARSGSCRHRHTGGDAHAGPVGCPSGAEGKLAEKLVNRKGPGRH